MGHRHRIYLGTTGTISGNQSGVVPAGWLAALSLVEQGFVGNRYALVLKATNQGAAPTTPSYQIKAQVAALDGLVGDAVDADFVDAEDVGGNTVETTAFTTAAGGVSYKAFDTPLGDICRLILTATAAAWGGGVVFEAWLEAG